MKKLPLFLFPALIFLACNHPQPTDSSSTVVTPVTITHPSNDSLNDDLSLSATATYLLKSVIKSNVNGYILNSNVKVGDAVNKNQILFKLKTKEATSLGNTISRLDSSFKFSGISQIKSPANGFIVTLNHQIGDYTQDGELLAEIVDQNSFGFIVSVPYADHQYMTLGKIVTIQLPDGRKLNGKVTQLMPTLDSISQTQKVLVKLLQPKLVIPENLIVNVLIAKSRSTHPTLPISSILTDESQQNFWVMKLINDSTAVKVPVKKGIENRDRVEIINPILKPTDRILVSGNYGLADTALVKITN